jgi:hypothetical protein
MTKITHPKVWASGEPQPEWSSIRRMPTRHERRAALARRNRRTQALSVLALAIASLVLFAVTLIVVWPPAAEASQPPAPSTVIVKDLSSCKDGEFSLVTTLGWFICEPVR